MTTTDLTQLYESAVLRWGDGNGDRKATDLENQVHELQEQVWCVGPLGDGTEQLALGVIEHIGGTFETEDAEDAVGHLGKAMVCAASYAYTHGLAFAPILKLARALTRCDDVQPVHGAGRLAAFERAEPVRVAKPVHVVEALGLCIAKGIDDCEILHGLTIEPHGVFLTIGREMLAAIDKQMKIDMLHADFKAGKIKLPDGWNRVDVDWSTPARMPGDRRPRAFAFPRDRVRFERFDPSKHVSHRGICPQCAAPMTRFEIASGPGSSEARDTGYRCSNGHELTTKQMDALLSVSTVPSKDQ